LPGKLSALPFLSRCSASSDELPRPKLNIIDYLRILGQLPVYSTNPFRFLFVFGLVIE
jgi:hypothetical protein